MFCQGVVGSSSGASRYCSFVQCVWSVIRILGGSEVTWLVVGSWMGEILGCSFAPGFKYAAVFRLW